jgi:hypothetical protein
VQASLVPMDGGTHLAWTRVSGMAVAPARRMSQHSSFHLLVVASLALACSGNPGEPPGNDGSDGSGASSAQASNGSGAAGGTSGSTGGGGGASPNEPITVVVLGSSTAAGKNLDKPKYGGAPGGLAFSWVNRYSDYLERALPGSRVVNLSMAGYGTFHALPTGTVNPPDRPAVDEALNITAALAEDPDAVIVNYPSGGDFEDGITVEEIMDNLGVIVGEATSAGVGVWVASPNPIEDTTYLAEIEDLLEQTLTTYGDHALDFWTPRAESDGTPIPKYSLTDGVHPNAEGHRLLFEVVVAHDLANAP